MGTLVGVAACGPRLERLEALIGEVFAEMRRLEAIFSDRVPTSAVCRVNASAGLQPVGVPAELIDVLLTAQLVARASEGAFDPTWAPLAPLWAVDAVDFLVPSAGEVERARCLVGHRDLVVDEGSRTAFLRRPGMRLGLGGVAKAAIAERGARFALELGATAVMVDAGGDIVTRSVCGTRAWRVGVRAPGPSRRLLASFELRDEAVATSGDDERCCEMAGRRYHHLLDPRTGWPAGRCRSATVVAANGALADALATALFVMGAEGLTVIQSLGAVEALVVADGGAGSLSRVATGSSLGSVK